MNPQHRARTNVAVVDMGNGVMLSQIEQTVYTYILGYIEVNKFPPTTREIQRSCNISTISLVKRYLDNLEQFGFISRIPRVARGIIIKTVLLTVKDAKEVVSLLGQLSYAESSDIEERADTIRHKIKRQLE